jgi:23S rRNA (cytidine1920-2'-O)/16S rRNA (cytidine1409-2'-O)-methyltransferase
MRPKTKERLDILMTERGLAQSRSQARSMIMAGSVLVQGRVKDKPGSLVPRDAEITCREDSCPYVSRGGLKLAGALKEWNIKVKGKTALDVGSSTGGFTDCLLQNGAVRVYALDVGKGQLAWKLRTDERVQVLEGINIRHLNPGSIKDEIELVTVDVSFIPLEKVLPKLTEILKGRGHILALVKPQFELGPKQVGKGGVVKDPDKQNQAVEKIKTFAKRLGLSCRGAAPAVIKGPKGNQEYFLYLAFPS